MKSQCIEMQVKSALNIFRENGYSINPYRGCTHGCIYCYASSKFWREALKDVFPTTQSNFEKVIVKTNIAQTLKAELTRKKPKIIYLGTITDPYQPCEGIKHITRDILTVLSYLPPQEVHILTKNTLIVRDIDILKKLSISSQIYVSFTITTLNREHTRYLEPHAPDPWLRLKAMETLADSKIHVGVSIAPIMPGINDNIKTLLKIWEIAKDHGASFFFLDALKLDRSTKRYFLRSLRNYIPGLVKTYSTLYQKESKPTSLTLYTRHLEMLLKKAL